MSERVAVIGLGLLGRGIAARFIACGFETIAVDPREEQRHAATAEIATMLEELITAGESPVALRSEWPSRFHASAELDAVKDCTFIVESATEDLSIKDSLLDHLEALVGADAVIASNTSSIPITRLQENRRVPERIVGMHWSQPAHITRFLEIVRGEKSSDAAISRTSALAQRLGQEPCICRKDVPGFIVNRIGYAMYREALHLLESGVADVETIDNAVRNALGLWASVCGPFRWIDISGGPALYAGAMDRIWPTLSNATEIGPDMRRLAEADARGAANGHGFYAYTEAEAERWRELFVQQAWRVKRLHDELFPLPTPTDSSP